jgi:bacteriocin biosynthesis cyclodehydratase domain-containing protein
VLLPHRQPVGTRPAGRRGTTSPPDRGLTHPYLAPWYRLARDDDRLLLEYGEEVVVFEGAAATALLPALLPLLDGTRTVPDIVGSLGPPTRPAVEHALALLQEHGLVTSGPPLSSEEPPPCARATLAHAAVTRPPLAPGETRERLRALRVRVAGDGAAGPEIARALRLSGLEGVERLDVGDPPPTDAVVVATPSGLELPALPEWNELFLASGTAWLQVLPFNGAFAAIGPLYVPGETCCYECYRRRRAANVPYPDEFWALERAPAAESEPPALTMAVAGIAATLLLRWLVLDDTFVPATLYALELAETPRLGEHVVYRVPRCPACSAAARQAPPHPFADSA